VCFGSFEQRFPRSRASVQSILQNVKADCVFFDVNIRMDFAEKEVIGFSLQACDVLKLNEDECALLGKLLYGKDLCVRSFCRRVAKDHDIQTVLVTLGAKGCFVYTRGGERHIESAPSSGGDTIGAGDAFSAAFLYAYLSGKDAFTAAHCGNVLGAFVAANTGALPAFSRTLTHTLHSIIDGEETSWRKEFSAYGKKYLIFPIGGNAEAVNVLLSCDGESLYDLDLRLCDRPDFIAWLDAERFIGKNLCFSLAGNAVLLDLIEESDSLPEGVYREELRPQLHYTPMRGWVNDPNGLVYAGGKYHLFYQHNPYDVRWGNMHWGHACSEDLIHWEEAGEALYPDKDGTMFSGCGVNDTQNVSGLGTEKEPPLYFTILPQAARTAFPRAKRLRSVSRIPSMAERHSKNTLKIPYCPTLHTATAIPK